jgi:CheY-like chemotaxis protein
MRVFILEDDPVRICKLHEMLYGCQIDHATSCAEVNLFQPPYDLILLDHDLGGRQMIEHEDSGYTFVNLIKHLINKDAIVVFHSFNTDGARMMQKVVGRGAVTPFGLAWFMAIIDTVKRFHKEP